MTDNLPSTPEGDLIRRAREVAIPKLSIRAAAKRIGMSPDHWGYVERGYRYTTQGEAPRPFSAPAATVAKMAHAVGITSDELADDGQRLDAADILIGIEHQEVAEAVRREGRPVALVAPVAVVAPAPVRPAVSRRPPIDFSGGDRAALRPFLEPVLRQAFGMLGITDRYGPAIDPSELPELEAAMAAVPGHLLFPDSSREAALWDDPALLLREKLDLLGRTRQLAAEADQREHRRPA